jgi:SulP family sulfate permease
VLEDLQRRIKSHPRMVCLLIRMHQVNNFDASGVHLLEQVAHELRARGGGIYFSGVNTRVFQVFKNSGLLDEVGESHIRTSTQSAIREAMRAAFCPAVCAGCGVAVFQECRELKQGHWETLGKGAAPRCGHSEAEHQAMSPQKHGRLEWPD